MEQKIKNEAVELIGKSKKVKIIQYPSTQSK